jgi:WXG100 family type VII secretion target
MGEMRVDPTAVHESGAKLQEIAHTLHSELSDSDKQIAASHSGWVGKSAEALASKAAEWREATRTHHGDINDHGEKFVKAARMYQGTDESTADEVKQAGSAIGPGTATGR